MQDWFIKLSLTFTNQYGFGVGDEMMPITKPVHVQISIHCFWITSTAYFVPINIKKGLPSFTEMANLFLPLPLLCSPLSPPKPVSQHICTLINVGTTDSGDSRQHDGGWGGNREVDGGHCWQGGGSRNFCKFKIKGNFTHDSCPPPQLQLPKQELHLH